RKFRPASAWRSAAPSGLSSLSIGSSSSTSKGGALDSLRASWRAPRPRQPPRACPRAASEGPIAPRGERAVSLGGRPFYFGTNVKMHQTPDDTVRYLRAILDGATETSVASTLFVCPPFTSLPAATALTRAVPLWIGAQN